MKQKRRVLYLSSTFLLPSLPNKKDAYQNPFVDIPACKTNRITYADADSLVNKLPLDFYANAPAEGHLGIGGEHARPLEKKREPIWVDTPEGKIDIGIVFAQDIGFQNKNRERRALGFSFDFTIDGKPYKKTYRKVVNDLPSLFHQMGKVDDNEDEEILKTSFFLWNERTINLRIDLDGHHIFYLNSVDFYYGDLPKDIWYAYLLPQNDNDRYLISNKQDFCHSHDKEYNLNIGTKAEFTLYSPYGSFYDRRYLEESFGVRRYPGDNELITDNNVVNGITSRYFVDSYLAPIGTTYEVERYSSYRGYDEKIILHRIVGDKKPPTIYFPHGKEIKLSYKSDFTSYQSYEGEVLITDNKDEIIRTKLLRKDGTELPENTCDTFDCILSCYDRMQNKSQEEVKVTLIDDLPPHRKAEYSDIFLPKGTRISKKELLSYFQIEDDIDKHPTRKIREDTYSGKQSVPGNYLFTVEGKDKEENTSSLTRKIHVKESFGEYYLRDGFVKVLETEIPTKEELVSLFIQSGRLPDKNYSFIEQIEGETISSNLKPGDYQRKLKLSSQGEADIVFPFVLSVMKKETDSFQREEKESFLERIISFILKIFTAIVDFFKNLFS